jgi:hypothetical protein
VLVQVVHTVVVHIMVVTVAVGVHGDRLDLLVRPVIEIMLQVLVGRQAQQWQAMQTFHGQQ